MSIRRITTLAAVLGLLGCGDENNFPTFPEFGDEQTSTPGGGIVGFYTGTEEISGVDDAGFGTRTAAGDESYTFPIALRLNDDGTFQLWSFGFPAGGGDPQPQRTCFGVYRSQSRTLEFFPNQQCGALPLSRYTQSRIFPDGLYLDARQSSPSVRVQIRVSRD